MVAAFSLRRYVSVSLASGALTRESASAASSLKPPGAFVDQLATLVSPVV